MKASPDFPTRRRLLAGAAAGSAALALPGSGRGAAPPPRRIGFALVGIGKLTQKQLIPALRTTKIARLTALVSGHADKAKAVAATASRRGCPARKGFGTSASSTPFTGRPRPAVT